MYKIQLILFMFKIMPNLSGVRNTIVSENKEGFALVISHYFYNINGFG